MVMKRRKCKGLLVKLVLTVLGFLFGLFCSLIFYYFVIQDTEFSAATQILMFSTTVVFLSFGFACSDQIRCIALLTIPEFGSGSGKRAVQAVIILLVLAGPMENMGRNGEEVVRMVSCFADMAVNITLTSKDILLAPIHHIFTDIKGEQSQERKKYDLNALKALVKPLEDEIESDNETRRIKYEHDTKDPEFTRAVERKYRLYATDSEEEKIEKRYKKKLSYRCQDIFTKGNEKCKLAFEELYEQCSQTVTIALAWALCWPMKLDHVCDLMSVNPCWGIKLETILKMSTVFGQGKTCMSAGVLGDHFGKTYLTAKRGLDSFSRKFDLPKVDYRGVQKWVDVGIERIKTNKETLQSSFKGAKTRVESALGLLKRILAFSYLVVVFKALKYHRKYLERISFDNHYITEYFRKIDGRRESQGRSTLLPLKTYEQSDFISVIRLKLTPDERLAVLPRLAAALLQVMVVSTLFVLDNLFTMLLSLLTHHQELEIQVKGDHILEFGITGKGALARLLRKIIKEINVQHHVNHVHEIKPCLPNPQTIHFSYARRVTVLFTLVLIICYAEVFCRRTRHCIANFFYKQRSKKRVVWLYNELLRRRQAHLMVLKRKLLTHADDVRKDTDEGFVIALLHRYPRLCKCLRRYQFARRKCLLCRNHGGVYRCPACRYYYCDECFADVGQECLYCQARAEMLQILQENSSGSSISDEDDDEKIELL